MRRKNPFLTKKFLEIPVKDILMPKVFEFSLKEVDKIILIINMTREVGFIHPIQLRKDIKNPTKYVLVSQPLHFFAAKILGFETVPSVILSLTEAEAELVFLQENYFPFFVNFFDKAVIYKKLIVNGSYSLKELSEKTKTTQKEILLLISFLEFTEEEKSFILNHNFSIDFAEMFIKADKIQRQKILNKIILDDLDETSSLSMVKEFLYPPKMFNEDLPKELKEKNSYISNDRIILNSFEKIIHSLKSSGIKSDFSKNEFPDKTEYTITIKNKFKKTKDENFE